MQKSSGRKEGDILFCRGHIRGLRKEIGEEGVADEGIFVSLMRPFGHGVGKERDVHIAAGCVFPRIGEPHDPVQVSVYALFIAVEDAAQRRAAAVPLYKHFRVFGKRRKVAAAAEEYVVQVPERFKEYKGQYRASDRGETDFNSNMFITSILYLPRTDEEKEAMYTYMDGLTEEEMETEEFREKANEFYKFNLTVAQVVAIKNDVDFQAILDERVEDKSLIGATGKLGTAGDYSYYYLIPDYTSLVGDALKEELPEDMYAEYQDVMANVEQDLISGVTLKGPHRAVEVVPVGTKISFETTDLNGNPVSSADLFAGHKVTMINLWATWCTYCKEEMPRLEEMNKELAEKDCQIIGVCCEIEDDTVEQANKILKAKGVTYTNIAQTPEMVEMLPTLGMPTTYFVDSEGRVLTVPVRGANFEGYSEKLEQALKAVE